jgi:hypothetical protein
VLKLSGKHFPGCVLATVGNLPVSWHLCSHHFLSTCTGDCPFGVAFRRQLGDLWDQTCSSWRCG